MSRNVKAEPSGDGFLDDPMEIGIETNKFDYIEFDQRGLECSSIEELIIFNETYAEILDSNIQKVEELLADNHQKQKQLKEESRLCNRADVSKRKVPVHLYMPPYFKDERELNPPMSAEARERLDLKWFDPLMKEEKKWTPSEIKTLRGAVKDAMVAHQIQPLCSRRDILVSKLRNQDVTTTPGERRQWTQDLEEIMRKIVFVKEKTEDDVLTASADYSVVPWNAVANVDFKGTRTEWAVRSKWANEVNPKWNKEPWSPEEVEKLKFLRESPKFVSWQTLTLALKTNRTAYQCIEKYKTEVSQLSKEWTLDEDTKLIALTKLASVNGHIQWDKVAQFMPGRTRQQVRTRYTHTLDATVKHGRWTDQEDVLLVCAVSRYGARDWAKVAQAVKNRTDSQCRERWSNVLNRSAHVNERFTLAEDEKLLYAVKIFGKGSWTNCKLLLPRKTPKQLRRRYLQLIAAKLRLVAGFCSAVDAMKSGRRDTAEAVAMEEEDQDILEVKNVPNDLMIETHERLAKLNPDINETPEEFHKRMNESEKPVAFRLRGIKNVPPSEELQQEIDSIVMKHKGTDAANELVSSALLQTVPVQPSDVRLLVQNSKKRALYYGERLYKTNVDKIGGRVRPKHLPVDPDLLPIFKPNDSEDDRVMTLVEALCNTVRQHDMAEWGKMFWSNLRWKATRHAKRFIENMICQKSIAASSWWNNYGPHSSNRSLTEVPPLLPVKTTLPPTAAALDLSTMLQRARSGLNKLAAEHFYPIDVTLDDQPNFTAREREQLDEKRRLNIELDDEVLASSEFAEFYGRMRTILLEPMRLQFARETAEEEHNRLCRDYTVGLRSSEDAAVLNETLKKPRMPEDTVSITPRSIARVLNDGLKIETKDLLGNIDKGTATKIERKRRINNLVEDVAKRTTHSGAPSISHMSIDSDDGTVESVAGSSTSEI